MSASKPRSAFSRRSQVSPRAKLDFLAGGGEAGALARSVDWAATAIGAVEGWSQALRSTASLVLHNHSGMLLWWGPEFVQIYNDAYRPVLGDKHPRAMGQRFCDCWAEVFHILGPMAERPFRGGPASTSDDIAVPINRKVAREEAHFRLAYSPVPDETVQPTGIGGVLATVTEITEQAYSDRQIRTLRELGARSAAHGTTAEQACAVAAATLRENPWDVPFALFYLFDESGARARLVASAGFDGRSIEPVAPAEVDLSPTADQGPWPVLRVAQERRVEILGSLPAAAQLLPVSPWSDPPRSAIALPLAAPEQAHAYGVLVCGVSPHRVLDAGYRTFFELAAAQIVTAIRNVRSLEEERKRAAALAEIDRAKTAFFSNVSHEFRTPLTLMLGPVEEAAADPETPARVRTQLALAHRNSLRLLKLVNSLLDFSRIEAGRMQASYEPTDLPVVTRDLASTFRSAMDRAGLRFILDFDDLGEPVYVDGEMWEKIVLNLLSNAFKYTFEGSVTVRLRRQGSDAALDIIDTGVGIPAHEMPRLFERFHRVEGTAGRTQEGSGIGLALVQELVKLHGGRITAVSEPGTGTTFQVRIPFGTAHLPAERIKAPRSGSTAVGAQAFVQEALRWMPADSGETFSRLSALPDIPATPDRFAKSAGARIVLADDNADMRAYVSALLMPTHVVEAVADGEQGLAAIRRERPDLVLCDIMMPRVDGMALLEALRTDEALRDIPVILLSARAGEEARVEGLDAGADDYLVKPFSARELLARVGALLELTRMRRENEERLRAFVSATSDMIYRMSPDWSEMRSLRGRGVIPDTDRPRRDWLNEYIFPEDQSQVMAAAGEAIRTRSIFQLEHRVRRVDGTAGWTLSRAVPLTDSHGNLVEWFGAAVDITERKTAEMALHRSQAWLAGQKEAFQAAVNGAPLDVSLGILGRTAVEQTDPGARYGFYITDADEMRHVSGMSEAYARRVESFKVGPNSLGSGLAAYTGQPVITADVTRDPRWTDWLWLAEEHGYRACWFFPVETETGKVVGTFAMYFPQAREATARDLELAAALMQSAAIIISRHQEAESLAQTRAALEDADRQKDEFLAMLAHELRNPLAPIGNASEILSRTLSEDARARAATAMIKRQTVQLTRLVDDLLDVSRITQGRIQLRRRPLDLAHVITQAVETVEPQLRQKQHRISVTTSGSVPMYVNGDSARLVQCVGNLLTNAVKYTEPRGEIQVRARAEDASAVIEVSDTGMGIAPELLSHVFELFVQSDRTLDRAQGGLGIGLAVVKRLVEMHGGQVIARSAGAGKGSTFEIRLPRIPRPQTPSAEPETFKASPRRVLIVDDNQDAANSLAVLLDFQGHQTEVAYSGREALDRIEVYRPEVALLDIGLPEMNGYELAKRLRAMPALKDLRLIALTGYGQAEDRHRAKGAGFDDHLVKPVDLPALERALAGTSAAGGSSEGDG